MITEEQIKKLKPGDTLVVHGEYVNKHRGGDIIIRCNMTVGGAQSADIKFFHPSCVSLPTEKSKYDPCRLFKKGDKVTPRKLFGRCYSTATAMIIGKICTVLHDEIEHYTVSIRWSGGECNINTAYLELITPVEEIEPYSVLETDTINGFDIMRDGLCVMTFPYGSKEAGYYRNELAAKEAAEAECARLNNLYKQELENNGRI